MNRYYIYLGVIEPPEELSGTILAVQYICLPLKTSSMAEIDDGSHLKKV